MRGMLDVTRSRLARLHFKRTRNRERVGKLAVTFGIDPPRGGPPIPTYRACLIHCCASSRCCALSPPSSPGVRKPWWSRRHAACRGAICWTSHTPSTMLCCTGGWSGCCSRRSCCNSSSCRACVCSRRSPVRWRTSSSSACPLCTPHWSAAPCGSVTKGSRRPTPRTIRHGCTAPTRGRGCSSASWSPSACTTFWPPHSCPTCARPST